MSKLAFKESEYFDESDEGRYQPAHEEDSVSDSSCWNEAACTDSYSLFDLDPTSAKDSSSKKSRKKKRKHSSTNTAIEDGEVESTSANEREIATDGGGADDNAEEVVTKSAKKKRKKRKVSVGGSFEDTTSVTPAGGHVSSFLAKFLSTKREAAEVPPPPEVEDANDSYLREFHADFAASSSSDAEEASDNENDQAEEQSSVGSEVKKSKKDINFSHRNDSTTSLYASTNEDEVLKNEGTAGSNTVALQLFNLPYRISVEQLKTFGSRHGLKFVTVTMGVDWKTKLPSGSATVHVELENHHAGSARTTSESAGELGVDGPSDEEVDECIQVLQGEDCGGRPLRVQRFVAKRRQSGSLGGRGDARYFSEDISCKCHNCGQVGHRQQECTNEAIPTPCHLCAGQDHEAGSCPNITCYRCGKFGHHSRDCSNASMAKPVICTNCGSPTHDIRNCRDTTVHYKAGITVPDSRVAGPKVRCMACNQYGHVMCQQLPSIPAESADDVYCPNCGECGHHIDFPVLCRLTSTSGASSITGGGESAKKKQRAQSAGAASRHPEPGMCMEPKYDAFVRFPQLLRELDDVPLNERLGYYKDITRRCGHGDQMLFPPLARQSYAANSANHSNNSSRNNSSANLNSRHSIGGDSRSVSLKLQDHDRSYRGDSGGGGGSASKNKVSALEKVAGRDNHRTGFNHRDDYNERVINSFNNSNSNYNSNSHSGRKRERDNERDWEDRGSDDRRQSGSHKRYRDASPSPPPAPSNSRRHSYPLSNNTSNIINAAQKSSHDKQKSTSHHGKNEQNHRSEQGSNSRPSAAQAPQVTSNQAWNERIESRKRRFNE